jgi:hypothetical protein
MQISICICGNGQAATSPHYIYILIYAYMDQAVAALQRVREGLTSQTSSVHAWRTALRSDVMALSDDYEEYMTGTTHTRMHMHMHMHTYLEYMRTFVFNLCLCMRT